jgi:hypothetical protein
VRIQRSLNPAVVTCATPLEATRSVNKLAVSPSRQRPDGFWMCMGSSWEEILRSRPVRASQELMEKSMEISLEDLMEKSAENPSENLMEESVLTPLPCFSQGCGVQSVARHDTNEQDGAVAPNAQSTVGSCHR